MLSGWIVLIPAYCPSGEFTNLVNDLLAYGADRIVVVNDGSPPDFDEVFDLIRGVAGVEYLTHPINRGKGAALKTGLKFIQKKYPALIGVVTADADGQHAVTDIMRVGARLLTNPEALVLGVRNFKGNLPWRSRFGNTVTKKVFGWVAGQSVTDTQTGLRGIPLHWLSWLSDLPGERYDYEIEMLLEVRRRRLAIVEESISTIYESGNPSSHFNPALDSLRIYWVLLRYTLSSLVTALVDLLIFSLLIGWWGNLIGSILVSRWLVGAGVNFTLNRSLVFRQSGEAWFTLLRYYLVVSLLGLLAILLISWLAGLTALSVIAAKIIVELCLFPLGFVIQRRWVFSVRNY